MASVERRDFKPRKEPLVPPTSRIEVDLAAMEHNVRVVRGVLERGASKTGSPAAGICAVLKADAYGCGAPRVAKRLGLAGVEMLAVYTPEQARGLIEANVGLPILVLMPVRELDRADALYRSAARDRIHFTVHDRDGLNALIALGDGLGMTLSVHLEVDTGMSRGGALADEAAALAVRIAEHPRVKLAGVYTHLAGADCDGSFARAQNDAFGAWLKRVEHALPRECAVHEANTFGVFRSHAMHRTMVRTGLALLGYGVEEFGAPSDFEFAREAATLVPAVRWVSHIAHLKWIAPGTPVGYGSTWRANRKTRVALVPVGYADGYPAALANKGTVAVELPGGVRAYVPVVGRVSMDQITIDVTDIPEGQVGVGSCVEVVGNDRTAANHLPVLAKQAGTITHELLCRFSARLPRTYIAVESTKVSGEKAGGESVGVTRAAV
ncbi:MAG TPA: alanine racemase [Phycisphaerales bacterium]|nr:alanine racemase [Phycisphaerales bacterium]